MNFTSGCEHHLQMVVPQARMSLTKPRQDLFYYFGCRKCPGKILIPAKDTKGKTIEALYAGVLEAVSGG
jgi:hypothetical protein